MRARCLVPLCLAVACGGDDTTANVDGGIDAKLGDPTVLAGYVNVSLKDSDPDYTSIDGKVNNAASPVLPILHTMTTDGDCQLRIPSYPFCSMSCGTGACVADETCMPYPTSQDVGTIHVAGVHTAAGASELDLVHNVSSAGVHSYSHGATSLAYPGFADGDPITVTASGSAYTPAFTLTAAGIAPLAITSSAPTLQRNTAIDVTWTPPATAAASRIRIKVDISHHGGLRGQIDCDTADDGSLTLGAAMLTQLIDLGVAGFPTIEVTRERVGSALTVGGRVDLTISSMISQAITIPGVISCNDDTMCTPPATCQPDLTCR